MMDLLFQSYRQIVHVQMTAQAFRIGYVDACRMGSPVAILALRDILVLFFVAHCAIDRLVFACRVLQFAVDLSVA